MRTNIWNNSRRSDLTDYLSEQKMDIERHTKSEWRSIQWSESIMKKRYENC
jgi:hypothetical protein